jgi:Fe-S cluster assembly protein SufD
LNIISANEGDINVWKAADRPIEIMYFTGNETALLVQPRNLIVVGVKWSVAHETHLTTSCHGR